MKRNRSFFWISVLVCSVGIGVCITAVLLIPPGEVRSKKIEPGADKTVTPNVSPVPAVTVPVPRRMPVAGAEGFFVVVELDGSSYLEMPDGKRETLTDAGEPASTPETSLVRKAVERLAQPPKKEKLTQLIVCDTGVVDVPKDAVITFVGRDKVVTLNSDGSSTVYHTDGTMERRGRADRRGGAASTRNP